MDARNNWTIFSFLPRNVVAFAVLGLAAVLWGFSPRAGAQTPAPLTWDALTKEAWPKPGDPVAQFKFTVTNTSGQAVTVDSVNTSCGCTVAKIPSQPWPIEAGGGGDMTISVNLAAKSGTFQKTATVHTTTAGVKGMQILAVVIHMPDSPEATRARNMQLASLDREAVFKGDCAKCHSDPAEGKMGKDLYAATCAVCHEAKVRATMVADLKHLNHATDYDFWKMTITIGKPGTLMPAFAKVAGGPLSDEQIDSLARYLVDAFPSPVINASSTKASLSTGTLLGPVAGRTN